MFNEPLHGKEYRGRYIDIWRRVFDEMKKADPNVELMINDYNIGKAAILGFYLREIPCYRRPVALESLTIL